MDAQREGPPLSMKFCDLGGPILQTAIAIGH
jgi:hypothetical protein